MKRFFCICIFVFMCIAVTGCMEKSALVTNTADTTFDQQTFYSRDGSKEPLFTFPVPNATPEFQSWVFEGTLLWSNSRSALLIAKFSRVIESQGAKATETWSIMIQGVECASDSMTFKPIALAHILSTERQKATSIYLVEGNRLVVTDLVGLEIRVKAVLDNLKGMEGI